MEINAQLPSQSTAFIGREREIAEIGMLFGTSRLLTLVGPGGIGKTRLALEMIARKSDIFADGSIFVPLAPLSSADNIPTTIASTFNISLDANLDAGTQILNYLRDKTLLLVLDNFEHVMDGAGLVAEILQAAPGVRILVTSREPLNLQDEWLWQVKGLPFPNDENNVEFGDYDAVQLFAQRARRVRHDFDVLTQAPDVIRICRLVEGMPLAVELAAGWLKTLTCRQIGDEIQRNLDILVSPARDAPIRHRSIRAVFDHSWKLMSAEQQNIFARLSVFRGGFALDAAEKVAGASLWMLASLVDKSLIHFDDAGRYSIHELLRQYGEEKLTFVEEADNTRDAHSAYFLDFLAQRLPDVKGRRQREATLEIDADFENIRVAWLRGVDVRNIEKLDGALDTLFIFVNHLRTQYRFVFRETMMQYALNSLDSNQSHEIYRFWWRVKGRYFGQQFLPSSFLEECLEIARAENDPCEIAFCLEWLGFSLFAGEGDSSAARACLEESVEFYRALIDPYNLAWCLYITGLATGYVGDLDKSRRAFQESIEIRQEIGDQIGQAWAELQIHSGDAYDSELERIYRFFKATDFYAGISTLQYGQALRLLLQGDFSAARAFAEEGFNLSRMHNYSYPGGHTLLTLAQLACIEGDYKQAKHFCKDARVFSNNDPILEFRTLAAEAITNFGMGNYDFARRNHEAALTGFLEHHNQRNILSLLPVSALLAAHEGQTTWACELLALAFGHPNAKTGWLHKWDLMTELRSNLERKLDADDFTAAWERGAKLDLEATVKRILAEKSTPVASIVAFTASPTLPEALTKRELEILRLIADGLQNQEIADHLFIAIGTVKTHINALYGKLDVTNRVKAVTHAREIGLL